MTHAHVNTLTEHDEDLVVECLMEGLGVEDIHVLHGLNVSAVRAFIADLTATDEINEF